MMPRAPSGRASYPVAPDTQAIADVSPEETRRPSVLAPGQRALQAHLLQHVSRTFALTIPRLAPALADVVGNGYLLCRLIDTIEDELSPGASVADREAFFGRFGAALAGDDDAVALATDLQAALRAEAPDGERELVQVLPDVLAVTARFDAVERAALVRCTMTMAAGMHRFEGGATGRSGLEDVAALERYCYHVAGVVGEMLTELFCHHSAGVAARRDDLLALAVPFGNGLQLTNILKDTLDDHARGVYWLPRAAFSGESTDFAALFEAASTGSVDAVATLDRGLLRLIGLCRGYLDDAVRYVLTIPREEHGMRVFCLWSVAMAVLTLRKIHSRRSATLARGARITRNSVRVSLLLSDLCSRHDALLRTVHVAGSIGLPPATSLTCFPEPPASLGG